MGAHSCGAAYVRDGQVVAVIEEERVIRVKAFCDYEANFERYPTESVRTLMDRHGLRLEDVDVFTSFHPYDVARSVFEAIAGFELPPERYSRVDHHEAHATLANAMAAFDGPSLSVCIDASGANGYSSKSYVCNGRSIRYVDGITTRRKSLGHFYAALTEFVGFRRLRDEGKIVGLSGHGQMWEDLYNTWSGVIRVEGTRTDEDNHPVELGGVYVDMYSSFFHRFGSLYWKNKSAIEDIAHVGQRLFEDRVVELISNIRSAHLPQAVRISVSGGVFANVRLNQRLNELPWLEEMFVLPPMGDEGLPLGCAVSVCEAAGRPVSRDSLSDVYIGNGFSDDEVMASGVGFSRVDYDPEKVARMLFDRAIVGLYHGRSEHGPRALGNRSIVCDCTRPETYAVLNGRLGRNDYMPFAPAVLDEDADSIFVIPKSRRCCDFMTMLVETRPEWAEKIPTVVHPKNKTARIQIVTGRSNPFFYEILKAYKRMYGIGILVNTSFNVHDEPIVDSPDDAFRHLRSGIVDALVCPSGIYR